MKLLVVMLMMVKLKLMMVELKLMMVKFKVMMMVKLKLKLMLVCVTLPPESNHSVNHHRCPTYRFQNAKI